MKAAAERLDRRVVSLGIFQYFKRDPHSGGGGSVGIAEKRKQETKQT